MKSLSEAAVSKVSTYRLSRILKGEGVVKEEEAMEKVDTLEDREESGCGVNVPFSATACLASCG